jgi:hypothetical protein
MPNASITLVSSEEGCSGTRPQAGARWVKGREGLLPGPHTSLRPDYPIIRLLLLPRGLKQTYQSGQGFGDAPRRDKDDHNAPPHEQPAARGPTMPSGRCLRL